MTQRRSGRSTRQSRRASEPGTEDNLQARFVSSNQSRLIHVDGAWGGITSHGKIYIAFYSEHPPIPEAIDYRVDRERGAVWEEHTHSPFPGIAREVEVEAIMDIGTARAVRDWLTERIERAEELGPESQLRVTKSEPSSSSETSP